jgi:hypothetical protein
MIEIRNLTKRFGKVVAVDDLSFSVDAGTRSSPRRRRRTMVMAKSNMSDRRTARSGPTPQ